MSPTARLRKRWPLSFCRRRGHLILIALVFLIGSPACVRQPSPPAPSPAPASLPARHRPHVVISSDFPPLDVIPGALGYGPPERRSDPDDLQSMVRMLLYANELRIEAIIAAAGTLANVANRRHVLDMLDRYDEVDEALRAHSPAFPSADDLRGRVYEGLSGTYGKPAERLLGEGKDSEASRQIVALVDAADEPLWFLFWGGTQELAQALWRVRRERTPEDVRHFTDKLRVYMIAHQDGTGAWIEAQFPALFVIANMKAYVGMLWSAAGSDHAVADGTWLQTHVRESHGALGAAYPAAGWSATPGVTEGDTPSFFYLLSGSRGLADLEDPTLGGWGGRFVPRPAGAHHFIDAPEGAAAIYRFRDAAQRDFAARMDWCVRPPGQINRAPFAALNGDLGTAVRRMRLHAGEAYTFDAAASRDPDGHPLSFHWWVYEEAGSFIGTLPLQIAGARVRVTGPALAGNAPSTAHLVLEVTDGGSPALTSYRRVVIELQP